MTIEDLADLLEIKQLPRYIDVVNETLVKAVATKVPTVFDPSIRVVKSTGKRLRPTLIIASSMIEGLDFGNNVAKSCAAIELIHIGSVVHDDIIDHSLLRWGQPTISTKEGINNAIVVGDYLFSLATVEGVGVSQEIAYEVGKAIARLCDGQSQEMADEYNFGRTIDDYLLTIKNKTGSLTAAACKMGAMCGGLDSEKISALAEFGEAFGMSYQLIDDLMDLLADEKSMGKPTGNDIKEGVYSLPVILSLKGEKSEELRDLIQTKDFTKDTNAQIVELLIADGTIEQTFSEIKKYNILAAEALSIFGDNKIAKGLSTLPTEYLRTTIKKSSYELPFLTS